MEALRDGRDVRASLMSQRGDSIICHILFMPYPLSLKPEFLQILRLDDLWPICSKRRESLEGGRK